MTYCQNKTVDRKLRELERAGWTVTAGGKHLKVRSPRGALVIVSMSPSCKRAEANIMRDLRRAAEGRA